MTVTDSSLPKPPWYWYLTPHRGRFLYICPDQELHLVRAVAWAGLILWRNDEVLVSLPQLWTNLGLSGLSIPPYAQNDDGLVH